MASIFKQSYSRRDPATGQVVRKKSRRYYIEYTDASDIRRRVRGHVDKEATRQLAAQLEKRAALESAGVVDPYAEDRRRPLSEHLKDYEAHLTSKDNTSKHVKLTVGRIEACLTGCRFRTIGDLDPNRVETWLAERRSAGISARTSNFYLVSVKSFVRWLQRSRRIPDNPLAFLQGVNPQTDVRRARRALTLEQLSQLFDTAGKGPSFRGMSGHDRAMLYATAAYTGLRAQELASLSVASFDFARKPPAVTVEAAYSKHRREDVLPLHPFLLEKLRPWVEQHETPETGLWPGSWPEHASDMIQADLKAASIPYETSEGFADFHSLRHTFLTNLARSGVHPKSMQALARHSTITLTLDRYSHFGLIDLEAALKALPGPSSSGRRSQFARATGTDGKAEIPVEARSLLTGQLTGKSDFSCRGPSPAGNDCSTGNGSPDRRKSLEDNDLAYNQAPLAHPGTGIPVVIRTPDLRFRKPF